MEEKDRAVDPLRIELAGDCWRLLENVRFEWKDRPDRRKYERALAILRDLTERQLDQVQECMNIGLECGIPTNDTAVIAANLMKAVLLERVADPF